MAAGVRQDTFDKIQTFSFSDIDRFSTGSLITRVTNDITQIQNFTQSLLRGCFRSPVMLVGALFMSFMLNSDIARVILVAVPFLALLTFLIIKTASPRYTAMQKQLDSLNTGVGEAITNVKVIKSFVREEHEKSKFRIINTALMDKSIAALKMMILMQPVSALTVNATTLIVVWIAGKQIMVGSMEVGTLTAFITYLSQVLTALNFLANIFLQGTRAAASDSRISEVMSAISDISDADALQKQHRIESGEIEFRDVSFRYFKDNQVPVLNNINIKINSGEFVGIIGSTGSGKTTLVSMIPRLYDPDEGSVFVDKVDVRELSLYELRENVSVVLQKNTLFSGTVSENLRWGNEQATAEELKEVCGIAQAHSFVSSFPEGYETEIGQGGANLSGGQKQRLCIARALLKKPKIMILDDSTSAVDTATDLCIRRALRKQLPDVTKLIIAQRISSVVDADKIIVMDKGKIVGIGTHDELLRSCTTYQEIYYSQKDRERQKKMNEARAARIEAKYSGRSISNDNKQLEIGPRGRNRGLGASGKPINLKASVVRLIMYVSFERTLIVSAIICSIICTVSSLGASYLLRPIINKFIYFDSDNPDLTERLNGLGTWLVILAAIYGISILTQWLQQRLMLKVSQRNLLRMRRELFAKLESLPVRYFDTHQTGDIMSRFTNDVDTIGEMLNTTLIQIISGALTLIGTVVLMIYTSPVLGAITIIATPVLTYLSKTIMQKGRKAYREQQKNLGMLNGFTEETVSGLKVVKVFNHEDNVRDEFAYLNARLCSAQEQAQFRSGIMGPVTHQLCNVIYAVVAGIGGVLVALKKFDVGGLTVSLNYTRQFNRPINEISMQINTVFAALAGAERVFDVMDSDIEEPDADTVAMEKIVGHIVLKNVNFGYTPDVTVLHDISLYAKPGQKIAFVGSTGAGKTTVTNLLSRFYDIQNGTITIDGVPIEKINRSFLRSNIAMVLQDTHLFTGTVRDNIRYGRLDATDDEVIEAAKIASADSFICQLEHGYDTVLENDGANLSQGQRQLLNIARAAISKAPILILDEATSSVDTRTERHIEEGMDALMENRTTFVIAHRLSTVRKSNAIMVLEKGRIIERGTHEELLAANGRYADLYNEIAELE